MRSFPGRNDPASHGIDDERRPVINIKRPVNTAMPAFVLTDGDESGTIPVRQFVQLMYS